MSRIMRRVRSTDTKPELSLRRALWRRGLRYRVHRKDLPGCPDVVFPSKRLAIFIDGDFWHGRQWETRGLPSLTSQFKEEKAEYWVPKIRKNVERDAKVNRALAGSGWHILRFWESDVGKDLDGCVSKVLEAVGG